MTPFVNSLQTILAVAFGTLLGVMALFCAFMALRERWLALSSVARALLFYIAVGIVGVVAASSGVLFVVASVVSMASVCAVFLLVGLLLLKPAKRLGAWPRIAAAVLIGCWMAESGGKGPLSGSLRATYLSILANGTLAGPTNVVASAAGAAAVQTIANNASNFAVTASNAIAWAAAEIPDLSYAVTNTTVAWMTEDIPQDTAQRNLVARCDLMQALQGTNGLITCYVRFNITPSTAPVVQFEAGTADGNWYQFSSISNSFPNTVPLTDPISGVSSCYVYTVSTPAPLSGITLVPQMGITFGGGSSNKPLGVLGSLMVNYKLGVTSSTITNGSKRLVFTGGILTGVL